MERCLPDVLVIGETKISSDFKTETFLVNNYQKPMLRDRNEFGGGIMLYVRKGVVCNRVPVLETPSLELLCFELIVSKRNGLSTVFTYPLNPTTLIPSLTIFQLP